MNRDPFAGALARAHAHVAALEGFEAYAVYLAAKDKGLKRDANRFAEAFAAALRAAPLEVAIERVRALSHVRAAFGDAPGLIPYAAARAAADICRRWEMAEPERAEPLLIRAGFQGDTSLIPEALRREPSSPRALKAQIVRLLSLVGDALHQIEDARLSGDPGAIRAALAELRMLAARLEDPAWSAPHLADADLFAALLDGLEAWRAAGEPGAFAAFMKARGVSVSDTPSFLFLG
ncbi:hypothetical protein ACWCOP_12500 [Maricaulaceae bacterium MS644]